MPLQAIPLDKQPLGWGSRAFYLPPAWPVLRCGKRGVWASLCVSVCFQMELPLFTIITHCLLALPAPAATNTITGIFLLEFLEAGTVPFWNRCS